MGSKQRPIAIQPASPCHTGDQQIREKNHRDRRPEILRDRPPEPSDLRGRCDGEAVEQQLAAAIAIEIPHFDLEAVVARRQAIETPQAILAEVAPRVSVDARAKEQLARLGLTTIITSLPFKGHVALPTHLGGQVVIRETRSNAIVFAELPGAVPQSPDEQRPRLPQGRKQGPHRAPDSGRSGHPGTVETLSIETRQAVVRPEPDIVAQDAQRPGRPFSLELIETLNFVARDAGFARKTTHPARRVGVAVANPYRSSRSFDHRPDGGRQQPVLDGAALLHHETIMSLRWRFLDTSLEEASVGRQPELVRPRPQEIVHHVGAAEIDLREILAGLDGVPIDPPASGVATAVMGEKPELFMPILDDLGDVVVAESRRVDMAPHSIKFAGALEGHERRGPDASLSVLGQSGDLRESNSGSVLMKPGSGRGTDVCYSVVHAHPDVAVPGLDQTQHVGIHPRFTEWQSRPAPALGIEGADASRADAKPEEAGGVDQTRVEREAAGSQLLDSLPGLARRALVQLAVLIRRIVDLIVIEKNLREERQGSVMGDGLPGPVRQTRQ